MYKLCTEKKSYVIWTYIFRTADSKLNNFTRIEPVLHLLGIPFDTNVARDVMTEKHGVATRLMYQLYVALNNKKKSNLTGVAMETMRPAAPAKLNAVESGIYKEVSAFNNEILYSIDYYDWNSRKSSGSCKMFLKF